MRAGCAQVGRTQVKKIRHRRVQFPKVQTHLTATMNPETRRRELKLELPPAPKPVAVHKPLVIVGNLACVSGHPKVINGCSALFAEVFGNDNGMGSRPGNIAVEIEAIVDLA